MGNEKILAERVLSYSLPHCPPPVVGGLPILSPSSVSAIFLSSNIMCSTKVECPDYSGVSQEELDFLKFLMVENRCGRNSQGGFDTLTISQMKNSDNFSLQHGYPYEHFIGDNYLSSVQ